MNETFRRVFSSFSNENGSNVRIFEIEMAKERARERGGRESERVRGRESEGACMMLENELRDGK